MNQFELCTDIKIVMELLNMTAKDIADSIGVTPMTISRWIENEEQASVSNLNAFYNFAFDKGIRLNKIKAQLFKEECTAEEVILFHGAKTWITGPLSIEKSKNTNDFGRGYVCGELSGILSLHSELRQGRFKPNKIECGQRLDAFDRIFSKQTARV